MRQRGQAGGMARLFSGLLIALVVLGLAATVAYLLSDLNQRRYRLAVHDDSLVVERGRFLPFGFEPFVPEDEDMQRAYAAIPIPPGASVGPTEIFEDRTELDRTLFALLAGWARRRIDDADPAAFALARQYIERCEALPSLAEEQRQEVRRLRGSLSYSSGMRLLARVDGLLRQAREHFLEAVQLNSPNREDALRQIQAIERRIAALAAAKAPPVQTTPGDDESLAPAAQDDLEQPSLPPLPSAVTPPGDPALDLPEPSGQQTAPPGSPTAQPRKWRL